jgi:hypothetical protein
MLPAEAPCPANAVFVAASVLAAAVSPRWLFLTGTRKLIITTGDSFANAKSKLPVGEEVKDAFPLTAPNHAELLKAAFPGIIFI